MQRALGFRWFNLSLAALGAVYSYVGRVRVSMIYKQAPKYLYKPRPDDIFIVTYPKSGTTLLQMMLHQLTTDGTVDFQHINSVSPWFEHELVRGNPARWEELPSPRFFKTHFRPHQLPRNARFIYILRDPGDVAISAYHHQRMMVGTDVPLEPAIDRFVDDRDPFFGSWFRHAAHWWPHRQDPNVLFLRYEDVIADLAGTVRKVAAFCGITVDEAAMPRILERCSVAFMKEHNAKFDPRLSQISRHRAEFIRQGHPGAGAREMTASQKERLAARVQALEQKLGCTPGELLRRRSELRPAKD